MAEGDSNLSLPAPRVWSASSSHTQWSRAGREGRAEDKEEAVKHANCLGPNLAWSVSSYHLGNSTINCIFRSLDKHWLWPPLCKALHENLKIWKKKAVSLRLGPKPNAYIQGRMWSCEINKPYLELQECWVMRYQLRLGWAGEIVKQENYYPSGREGCWIKSNNGYNDPFLPAGPFGMWFFPLVLLQCPSKIHLFEAPTPKVTLFGDKGFKEVIKGKWEQKYGALLYRCPYKKKRHQRHIPLSLSLSSSLPLSPHVRPHEEKTPKQFIIKLNKVK